MGMAPMRLWIVIGLLGCFSSVFAEPEPDSLLLKLDEVIGHRQEYVLQKMSRINELKAQLVNSRAEIRYYLYAQICDEYKTFIYDSAFIYVRKLQQEAYRSHDPSKIAFAKVKLGFILLSSGMFNEALDSLLTVNQHRIGDSVKIEFYSVVARTYYDLVDFNRDPYFTERYTKLGNHYVDSALVLCDTTSNQFFSLRAMKYLRMEKIDEARADLEHVLSDFSL